MSSKTYFDTVSNEWDSMRQSFFSNRIREKMCETAEVQAGETAADVGAGTGFITEELIRRGLRVTAIDQSQEMLDILKSKFGSHPVTCRQGIAYALPLADSSVDYVMANMYLHHVEQPDMAIAEMVRILKPKGKIVIADLDKHEYEFLRTEQQDVWLGFDRNDIKKWFQAAGLNNVQVNCLGETCSCDSDTCCDKASISIFIASGQKL